MQRYWDGTNWTPWVWSAGQQAEDPLEHSRAPADPLAAEVAARDSNAVDVAAPDSTDLSEMVFPQFQQGWSEQKQQKKTAEAARHLAPGERVLYQGTGGTMRPLTNDLVVTNARVFSYNASGVGPSVDLDALAESSFDSTWSKIVLSDRSGSVIKINGIPPKELPVIEQVLTYAANQARPATPPAKDVATAAVDPHDEPTVDAPDGLVTALTFPRFQQGWSERKCAKKAAEAATHLHPDESVVYLGTGGTLKTMTSELVVTNARVFCYGANGVKVSLGIESIADASFDAAGRKYRITDTTGSVIELGLVPVGEGPVLDAALAYAASQERSATTRDAMAQTEELDRVSKLAIRERWPDATILGKITKKADASIRRLCHGDEAPWLVIAPGFAYGVLAAFNDRLAIIKTGAATSLMAGSLGGERTTTFYFVDINAIEYNSGLMSGVLEVLTASYQGTSNKDYWRGTTQSRNANSDDPFTLSNTLPMVKSDYAQWSPHIQELRSRISASKRPSTPTVVVTSPAAASSELTLVEQLERLAALRASGVLSEEEFAAAKTRLMDA